MRIDKNSPAGNAWNIMAQTERLLRAAGREDVEDVLDDMMSGDYDNLCEVAERATHGTIKIIGDGSHRDVLWNAQRFSQIQCVPVPNVSTTQCNVYMYGLDDQGRVWFKRDCDSRWMPESMKTTDPLDTAE